MKAGLGAHDSRLPDIYTTELLPRQGFRSEAVGADPASARPPFSDGVWVWMGAGRLKCFVWEGEGVF